MNPRSEFLGSAKSADGRTFAVASATDDVQVGSVVALSTPDAVLYVGQILTIDASGERSGAGVVLGTLGEAGLRRERRPFRAAEVLRLTEQQIDLVQESVGATLEIGQWQLPGGEARLRLRPQGFNRHTFMCGQSGSGKTYALGVVLERLLLETRLPMLILDPNGDYARLGDPRPDAPADAAQALRALQISVLGAHGENPLRVAFLDLPRRVQAAILELDPIRDLAEYSAWLSLDATVARKDLAGFVKGLLAGDADHHAFGQRLVNLGKFDWPLWSGRDLPQPEHAPRAKVFDLSGFEHREELTIAAISEIERLWEGRAQRRPLLIVIDEAHNLCPSHPATPVEEALVERLITIAAEGRKYGLWLLLATQRPSKVHPQVISQCDNLLLMRMNSPADLADLGQFFGFVPSGMLQASPFFAQGEVLAAGAFVPVPCFGKMGARLTWESGSDIRVPMPALAHALAGS